MECSCSINGSCDGEYDEDYKQKDIVHKSDKLKKCGECDREIKKGEKYEWYRGGYDGSFRTHNTCLDCVSLRENFFYDWTFEQLWDDFYYHMEECNWEVPEKCLSNCTPTTREKICQYIEVFWAENDSS